MPNGGPYLEQGESSSRAVSLCLQISPCGSIPATDYSKLSCGFLSFWQEWKKSSPDSQNSIPVTNGCIISEHRIKLKNTLVNIRYLVFCFWPTSLCMAVYTSIHITKNDPVLFLLRLCNTPCIYVWHLYLVDEHGREAQEEGDVYTHAADSLCFTAETNATLKAIALQ